MANKIKIFLPSLATHLYFSTKDSFSFLKNMPTTFGKQINPSNKQARSYLNFQKLWKKLNNHLKIIFVN